MTTIVVLVLLVIAAIVAFLYSARRGALERLEDPTEAMDADSRSLYGPIRRLSDEIEQLASKQDSMTSRILGEEAANEARRIREQCAKALVARTELKRASRGKGLAEHEVAKLEQQVEESVTEAERAALQSAVDARKLELSHYGRVTEAVTRIDGGVQQAKAVLSEMKTRLMVASSSEKVDVTEDEDLRATIGRLKTLSVSYDEAEQTLRS